MNICSSYVTPFILGIVVIFINVLLSRSILYNHLSLTFLFGTAICTLSFLLIADIPDSISALTPPAIGWGIDLLFTYFIFFLNFLKSKCDKKYQGIFHILYSVVTLIEMKLWIPLVHSWSIDHCFLDGFIDVSTAPGVYATGMVTIIYIIYVIRIWDRWFGYEYHIKFIGCAVVIILFYNLCFGITFYFIINDILSHSYGKSKSPTPH